MARYVYDYQGMYGVPVPSRGMDPNHQGGYRGERMEGGPYLAAYGTYREHHRADLGPPPHAPALPPGEESTPGILERR